MSIARPRPGAASVVRVAGLLVGALVTAVLTARGTPAVPDLVLVVVVAAALGGGRLAGAATGLAGGWVLDLLPPAGSPLGAQALLYAVLGHLASRARRPGPTPLLWVAAVTGGAALLGELVRLVAALATGSPTDPVAALLRVLATATAGLVLVPLLARLEHVGAGTPPR